MDWSDKTAQAKVWFESLRDQICAEFESIEREAGSDASFQYTPGAAKKKATPIPAAGCRG